MINATAQHIFPEQPAPSKAEGVQKEVKRDGVDSETEGEEERDEEPLIGGTPLEEMKTPMVEAGSYFGGSKQVVKSRKEAGGPLVSVPKEVVEE